MTGSIYLRSRPIRTAFLVDLDAFHDGTPELYSIFDNISTYALENWAARRDTIHCFNSSAGFSAEEWFDLEEADPDRLYTFSPLSDALLEKLHQLRPWSIIGRPNNQAVNKPITDLPGVSVIPTVENLAKFNADLLLLAFTPECPPEIHSFLHRNFGTYFQWTESKSPRIRRMAHLEHTLESAGCREDLISDLESVATFFRALGGNLAEKYEYRPALPFVAPCQISALLPRHSFTGWNRSNTFNVFVGASSHLFAAYWNDAASPGRWSDPFKHNLWIPPDFLSSPDFTSALALYVWQYAGLHSSGRRSVNFVSDDSSRDITGAALQSMAQGLRPVPATYHRLSEWETARRTAIARERRDYVARPHLDSRSAVHFRIYEEQQIFPVDPPPSYGPHGGSWAVEAQVECDYAEGVGNRTNFYLLPKQRGSDIASYLLKTRARVDKRHLLVAQLEIRPDHLNRTIAPEIKIDLIPSSQLVSTLLVSESMAHLDPYDLRQGHITTPNHRLIFQVSEPGRHLRGLLTLFGSLEQARSYTERKLWKRVFLFLSGSRFAKDENQEEMIKNRFLKKLQPYGQNAEKLAFDLARDASRLIQAKFSDRHRTLTQLRKWLDEDVASAPDRQDIHYGSNEHSYSNQGVGPISAVDFDESMEFLIARDIFHLGVSVKCPNCSGVQWYPTKDLAQQVECAGCGYTHPLVAAPEWSYRLNTLVQRAVCSGTLTVFQALLAMSHQGIASFFHTPSLEITRQGESDPLGEIDLVCLLDGQLVFGEVKGGRPLKTDFEQFQENLILLRPDRAIVFVLQEHQEEARKFFDPLKSTVAQHGIPVSLFTLPTY